MYRITRFEADSYVFTIPQANGVQDGSGPEAVSALLALPSGGAFDGLGYAPAQARWPRELGLSGEIVEANATLARFAYEDLLKATGRRGRLYRVDEYDAEQWCVARCQNVRLTRTPRTVLVLPVDVSMMQMGPWQSVAATDVWTYGNDYNWGEIGLRWGCTGPVTITETPHTLTLTNVGTAQARNIRLWVEVIPPSWISDLRVSAPNVNWTWEGTLTPGTSSPLISADQPFGPQVEIDCGALAARQRYRTLSSAWVAANYLTIDAQQHKLADLLHLEADSMLDVTINTGLTSTDPQFVVTVEMYDTWM